MSTIKKDPPVGTHVTYDTPPADVPPGGPSPDQNKTSPPEFDPNLLESILPKPSANFERTAMRFGASLPCFSVAWFDALTPGKDVGVFNVKTKNGIRKVVVYVAASDSTTLFNFIFKIPGKSELYRTYASSQTVAQDPLVRHLMNNPKRHVSAEEIDGKGSDLENFISNTTLHQLGEITEGGTKVNRVFLPEEDGKVNFILSFEVNDIIGVYSGKGHKMTEFTRWGQPRSVNAYPDWMTDIDKFPNLVQAGAGKQIYFRNDPSKILIGNSSPSGKDIHNFLAYLITAMDPSDPSVFYLNEGFEQTSKCISLCTSDPNHFIFVRINGQGHISLAAGAWSNQGQKEIFNNSLSSPRSELNYVSFPMDGPDFGSWRELDYFKFVWLPEEQKLTVTYHDVLSRLKVEGTFQRKNISSDDYQAFLKMQQANIKPLQIAPSEAHSFWKVLQQADSRRPFVTLRELIQYYISADPKTDPLLFLRISRLLADASMVDTQVADRSPGPSIYTELLDPSIKRDLRILRDAPLIKGLRADSQFRRRVMTSVGDEWKSLINISNSRGDKMQIGEYYPTEAIRHLLHLIRAARETINSHHFSDNQYDYLIIKKNDGYIIRRLAKNEDLEPSDRISQYRVSAHDQSSLSIINTHSEDTILPYLQKLNYTYAKQVGRWYLIESDHLGASPLLSYNIVDAEEVYWATISSLSTNTEEGSMSPADFYFRREVATNLSLQHKKMIQGLTSKNATPVTSNWINSLSLDDKEAFFNYWFEQIPSDVDGVSSHRGIKKVTLSSYEGTLFNNDPSLLKTNPYVLSFYKQNGRLMLSWSDNIQRIRNFNRKILATSKERSSSFRNFLYMKDEFTLEGLDFFLTANLVFEDNVLVLQEIVTPKNSSTSIDDTLEAPPKPTYKFSFPFAGLSIEGFNNWRAAQTRAQRSMATASTAPQTQKPVPQPEAITRRADIVQEFPLDCTLPKIEKISSRSARVILEKITDADDQVRYRLKEIRIRGSVVSVDQVRINDGATAQIPCDISLGSSLSIERHVENGALSYMESGTLLIENETTLKLDPKKAWEGVLTKNQSVETIQLSASLSTQEGLNNQLSIEVIKTTDKISKNVSYTIGRVIKRGIEITSLQGKPLPLDDYLVIDGDTKDYWETIIVSFNGSQLEIAEENFDPAAGRIVPTKMSVDGRKDEAFDLELRVAHNPRTNEKIITSAQLKPLLDLKQFDTQNNIFSSQSPILSTRLPLAVNSSGQSLDFTHTSLGNIALQLKVSQSGISASRQLIEPQFQGEELDRPQPTLASYPTRDAMIQLRLAAYTSRRYHRDITGQKRYLIPPTVLSQFLDWMKLLGQKIDFDPTQQGFGLEIRFDTSGVRFHQTQVNPDGSLKVVGLDLTSEEYKIWDDMMRGLDRPGASALTGTDISTTWPAPAATDHLDIQPKDQFIQTPESIRRMSQLFSQTPLLLQPGDVLPADLFEIECPRSGLILRLPVMFFGRVDPDGEGRQRAPIKFLERSPMKYYFRGQQRHIRQVPRSYVLRDQSGFPQIYHLQRDNNGTARPINLKGIPHTDTPLLYSFAEMAEFLPRDTDTQADTDSKSGQRRKLSNQATGALSQQIQGALDSTQPLPTVPVFGANKVFRVGDFLTIEFLAEENGQETRHTLTGISVDKANRVLNLHTPTLDGAPISVRFAAENSSLLILSTTNDIYQFDLLSGELRKQVGPSTAQVDPTRTAQMIRKAGLNLSLVSGVQSVSTKPQRVGQRNPVTVHTYTVDYTDPLSPAYRPINLPALPSEERGFLIPDSSQTQKLKNSAKITNLLDQNNFHGAFFKPAEETLFDQLLVGGDESVMTFVTDEGIILQMKMKADVDHPKQRYLFSKTAHQMDLFRDFRLLLPDPENEGEYIEIDNSVLTVTTKRLPGQDRNEVELTITPPRTGKPMRFVLSEVSSTSTLQGTSAAGMTAFGFYAWDSSKNSASDEQAAQNRARAGLAATVNFFNLHQGPSVVSTGDAVLQTVNEGVTGIKLSDGSILDAGIVEMSSGHLMLDGLRTTSDDPNRGYLWFEKNSRAGASAAYQAPNRSSYFPLEDVSTGEKRNLIVTKDGKASLWPRRRMAGEWTSPRVKADISMQKIAGGSYSNGDKVRSLVERKPAIQDLPSGTTEGINLKSVWGRSLATDALDLVAGKMPKLSLFVHESNGTLKAERGVVDSRDVSKGDYYPFGDNYELDLVEDKWQDPQGQWQSGKVRTFARNINRQSLEGTISSPYGYNVFENRAALTGSAADFKSQKVEAHYHEDPERYADRKLMPSEAGSVYQRAGIKPAEIDWQAVWSGHTSDEAQAFKKALAEADGSFGHIATYLGALHFLSANATDENQKNWMQHDDDAQKFVYDDSILASLARYHHAETQTSLDLSNVQRSATKPAAEIPTAAPRTIRRPAVVKSSLTRSRSAASMGRSLLRAV